MEKTTARQNGKLLPGLFALMEVKAFCIELSEVFYSLPVL